MSKHSRVTLAMPVEIKGRGGFVVNYSPGKTLCGCPLRPCDGGGECCQTRRRYQAENGGALADPKQQTRAVVVEDHK